MSEQIQVRFWTIGKCGARCGRLVRPLDARADVMIFSDAFADEDDAAAKLADFDIVLSMRERTPFRLC